jgi:putative permease
LTKSISAQDQWSLPVWLQGSTFQQVLVARMPPPMKLFEALTGDHGQLILPVLFGFSQGFGQIFSAIFVILFLSIYWSRNQSHFERLWLSLLPSTRRKQAREIWRTIELDVGAYMRSEMFQSILAGLLLGGGYWLLGSPYPVLLAVIGALAWMIPVVGAVVALISPLILGMFTSIQLGILTAIYTLGVLIIVQLWIEPRLFRRTWDNPILTMIIMLIMADAFGLIGVMVAPPISAVCQILWKLLVNPHSPSGAANQISELKARQANIWEDVRAMNEPPLALVTNSMERLNQLLQKAEPVLPVPAPDEPPH